MLNSEHVDRKLVKKYFFNTLGRKVGLTILVSSFHIFNLQVLNFM